MFHLFVSLVRYCVSKKAPCVCNISCVLKTGGAKDDLETRFQHLCRSKGHFHGHLRPRAAVGEMGENGLTFAVQGVDYGGRKEGCLGFPLREPAAGSIFPKASSGHTLELTVVFTPRLLFSPTVPAGDRAQPGSRVRPFLPNRQLWPREPLPTH